MRRVTSGVGTFRTSCDVRLMSAFRGRSEVAFAPPDIHNGGFATGRSWREADIRKLPMSRLRHPRSDLA
jgi:hypothetical protein